ncbi:MAG TPA: hypothetical protein VFL57_19980, partial [Bryobacteraceae bacterium]|nr:hypothetical protein [Bryobacteraceae bacterium]
MSIATLALAMIATSAVAQAPPRMKVRISWGHEASQAAQRSVKLIPSPGITLEQEAGFSLEAGETRSDGVWRTRAGGVDIDGLEVTLVRQQTPSRRIDNLHIIWADLIAAADPDTARRLNADPAMLVDEPKLTVQMNGEGTAGFSVAWSQLAAEKAMWIPSLGIYITNADRPVPFDEHRKSLESARGRRILDRVQREPEATYEEYTARWEDMGHPLYTNPQPRGPGHIVGLTWDSAISKFGIDRAAGVWNDYGNPDKFQLWYSFGDLSQGVMPHWKSQRLEDGLPVVTTVFERDGLRYEVEQFAYPLNGPPPERRGNISMVLMQRVRVTDLTGRERDVSVTISHRRQFPPYANSSVYLDREGDRVLLREPSFKRVLLAIDGAPEQVSSSGIRDYQRELKRIDVFLSAKIPARASREFIVKLPSLMVDGGDASKLAALAYPDTRAATVKFWSDYVGRGAQFRVPEKVVNDLFRASLWHALRLPRRHGGEGPNTRIDLPYSNFAYSQTGTPWPVNQAVYVDYMLYDLRGYHTVSSEELAAQYRNNQEIDGHVNGYANWGVYTPSMLYTVAQNYLLSGDRATFDRLLPASMKAFDWCLNQLRQSSAESGPARGLLRAPLNDGTGEGWWAFNQAYLYAGLELFGRALQTFGHPRATEARAAAKDVFNAIDRAFHAASVNSPVVQLRDQTWIPYVPCEARTPRRLLEQWYPTDVDTGAAHLIRLKAVEARGDLADYLLHDHEDNLFYKGWGIANEPVYNQHATGYVLRDDPKAVIRAFYSYMASAFSHSMLEPVEHRWTHGQYFGPPSTDGAWFELYRNMLIHERDDGAVVLGLATPRAWLQDGKTIEVERAPTYYGPLGMRIESRTASGRITATVD